MIFVDTRVIHDLDTLEYNMDEGHDTLRDTIRAKFDASEATITHKYTQIHTNTHKYTQIHTVSCVPAATLHLFAGIKKWDDH